ncbi:radical SAM protein [Oceanidesulfovibrio marinus]|uniref:Radical SAM protein n=1 Tax=Oceanidesulfovibrio marinus TaxID=370038 RepID=A0ABX6NJF3_9BACT|nr:radical SAM protein [Oceanidesulfovibrio marinus]QJT09815.1 radical SAM protein [Oceanidesulfovibrio marinus]
MPVESHHTFEPYESMRPFAGGSLDISLLHPENGGQLERREETDGVLYIQGWTMIPDRSGFTLPERVLVVHDQKIIGQIELTDLRPDRAEEFGFDPKVVCGFRVAVPLSIATGGLQMISIIAESSEGEYWMVGPRRSEWVQLEVTGRCNLKCPQCPNNSFSSAHNQELEPQDLKLIQPVLDMVTHGCLDGFGEIFMSRHAEHFLSAIHWSKNFLFHTNAQLLDKQRANLILDHSPPIRKIIISLDTLDTGKYRKLRAGGELDRALDNTRQLIALREERGQKSPRVGINLTYMKENAGELADFVRMAASLDGYFELNFLYDAAHLNDSVSADVEDWTFNYEEQKPKYFARQAVEEVESAMATAKELGVEFTVSGSMWRSMLTQEPDEYGYCGGRFPVEQCGAVDNTRMLLADGRVQYCVWQTSSMYNWRDSGIVEPKDHPRGKAVRDMIKHGIVPHECAGAGCSWVGLMPSTEGGKGEMEDASNGKAGGWSGSKV